MCPREKVILRMEGDFLSWLKWRRTQVRDPADRELGLPRASQRRKGLTQRPSRHGRLFTRHTWDADGSGSAAPGDRAFPSSGSCLQRAQVCDWARLSVAETDPCSLLWEQTFCCPEIWRPGVVTVWAGFYSFTWKAPRVAA